LPFDKEERDFNVLGQLTAIVLILLPSNAYAYMDPGTVSIVMQFVFAGLVSGLYVVKNFWVYQKVFSTRYQYKPRMIMLRKSLTRLHLTFDKHCLVP
jgi:hypothetical protein